MIEVNKDMLIGDLLQLDEGVGPLLMAAGMYCISCPASLMETLEEAAWVHGIDTDSLVDLLNEYFELKNNQTETQTQNTPAANE